MIKTGCKDLDDLIKGYKEEITIIYGPAGTGKTTLAKLATLKQTLIGKKVVYVDTENGFSVERFMQLANHSCVDLFNKILLLKVNDFEDQCKKFEIIEKLERVDLIIVDTIGRHYRRTEKNDENIKKLLRQLRILVHKTKEGIPVIITNQVYSNMDNEIIPVGGNMFKKFGKCIIELQKEPRKLIIKKPEKKEMFFEIKKEGIFRI